jgi:hypothetical protein
MGVDHQDLHIVILKDVVDRLPENAGRFHGHVGASLCLDQVSQVE